MFRIEYGVPVVSRYAIKYYRHSVIFADDLKDVEWICNTCDRLSYPIYDVSNYIEDVD